MEHKKVGYICGKITGLPRSKYYSLFEEAEKKLVSMGYEVINPVKVIEDLGWEDRDYNQIMDYLIHLLIDKCDFVFMLSNWTRSAGAIEERKAAISTGKKVFYNN